MIDNLRINVAQLMKDPVGSYRHVDVAADLEELVPDVELAEGEASSIIEGRVRLMRTNQGVLAQGVVAGEVQLPCARCLAPTPVEIEAQVEEVFVPTIDMATGRIIKPEEEDRALWIDEHHILDLAEVLRQDVLLELPMHLLCKEDCRGLCPECGTNLNEGSCDCKPDIDPRWSSLTDLLQN